MLLLRWTGNQIGQLVSETYTTPTSNSLSYITKTETGWSTEVKKEKKKEILRLITFDRHFMRQVNKPPVNLGQLLWSATERWPQCRLTIQVKAFEKYIGYMPLINKLVAGLPNLIDIRRIEKFLTLQVCMKTISNHKTRNLACYISV